MHTFDLLRKKNILRVLNYALREKSHVHLEYMSVFQDHAIILCHLKSLGLLQSFMDYGDLGIR